MVLNITSEKWKQQMVLVTSESATHSSEVPMFGTAPYYKKGARFRLGY